MGLQFIDLVSWAAILSSKAFAWRVVTLEQAHPLPFEICWSDDCYILLTFCLMKLRATDHVRL